MGPRVSRGSERGRDALEPGDPIGFKQTESLRPRTLIGSRASALASNGETHSGLDEKAKFRIAAVSAKPSQDE